MIAADIRRGLGLLASRTSESYHPQDPALRKWFATGPNTSAGVVVDENTALSIPAFWRGLNVLSNSVAKLPVNCYQRLDGNGRTKATDHPAHRLLRKRPGAGYTPFAFRQTLQSHAQTYGGGFAYVFRDGGAVAQEMVILDPSRTVAMRTREEYGGLPAGSKVFMTNVRGQDRVLLDENVIHIYGLGYDGLAGYPVIEMLAEALGGGLAAQQFGAKFFGNGANAGGLIQYPGRLPEQAYNRLKESFSKKYVGLGKAHSTIVLEDGATYHQLTIPPDNAQFLETREFNIREVANVIGIQSHKLGDQSRKSYNSLEQSNQEFLDDDVDPWLIRWEQECERKLLTDAEFENDTHYIEFERKALLRMDATTRATFYGTMREKGIMSANEVRAAENMEPMGEEGDRYFVPSNWVPADKVDEIVTAQTAPKEPPPVEGEETDEDEDAEKESVVAWFANNARERLTRQADAKRGKPDFMAWVDSIPEEQGPPALHSLIAPAIRELKAELRNEE